MKNALGVKVSPLKFVQKKDAIKFSAINVLIYMEKPLIFVPTAIVNMKYIEQDGK